MPRFRKKSYLGASIVLLSLGSLATFVALRHLKELNSPHWLLKSNISQLSLPYIQANQELPAELNIQNGEDTYDVHLQWTFDERLQARVRRIFETTKPDYAAFVAINAKTGQVLAIQNYHSRPLELNQSLALRATFPAASIFKIVTATAGFENGDLSPDSVIPFNGAAHTLYKKNVNETKINRWTRYITLREAFAKSINTVFGKIGLFRVGPKNLLEYAQRFGFDRKLESDFQAELGSVKRPDYGSWSTVEMASGFSPYTTLSALQGAMMASAFVNDGKIMKPYVIERAQTKDGKRVYVAQPELFSQALKIESIPKMRRLLQETVLSGTARKAFRTFKRTRKFEDIEMGGKTGSLSGGNPKGKCDWFVGYMGSKEDHLAFAVLTVNVDRWKIKSSEVASQFIHYFIETQEAANLKSFNGAQLPTRKLSKVAGFQ